MAGRLAGVPMAASKRPSTSSLRRFITSRPYVTVAELRRRFGLDDPDAMSCLALHGRQVYVGLPEREALKIDDLLGRGEIGVELSVEVRAPVAVGVYPMRLAHYVIDGPLNGNGNGDGNGNGVHAAHGGGAEEPLAVASFAAPGQAAEVPLLSPPPPAATTVPPQPMLPHPDADHEQPETVAGEPIGVDLPGSPPRARDPRATRHNGRPVPRRHRGSRHHRPHAGPGGASGNTSPGPQ